MGCELLLIQFSKHARTLFEKKIHQTFVCTNISVIFASEMGKIESKYCGCLYYSTNALARVMTKMADQAFASVGLTSSYAFLLMTVNDRPGIHPKEISQQMLLTQSTVTRLIEKMEHRGLLTREQVGRTTEVYPTDKSLKLNDKIKTAWQGLYKNYSQIIGEENGIKLTTTINEAMNKLE